jgi:hypothetical protein
VENSLDIILTLPEVLTSMFSSDIDLMYQKMNQNNVVKATSKKIRRAASIADADAFFIVVRDTALGNFDRYGFLVQLCLRTGSYGPVNLQYERKMQQRHRVSTA